MPLSAGTTLGHYEILTQLGAGGMGEVYLAQDTRLNRKVALKVLPTALISNPQRLYRFELEAQAASSLNHPNILTVYEIGIQDKTHFIATEFIEGETLRRKLQTTGLGVEETLQFATQIAAALDAAHRNGIIHRDIKPENIMMHEDGLVKVLDFGLAKLTETTPDAPVDTQAETFAQVKTMPGSVMGTVAYMSPEQARGLEVDARTDIFSLGAVLYEMLTGAVPFKGATTNDMIAAILTTEPAPLGEDAPAELQRIVKKALQKNAEKRYQTVKDLVLDLRSLQDDLNFTAELERSGMPSRSRQPTPTQDQNIQTTWEAAYITSNIKQHKLGIAVALLLLLPVIGFGYWYLNHRGSTATQIESIAVLPFKNESDSADLEYLSDGMTESLINSLSQLPHLSVKARSSVFRYKGKGAEAQQVASDLSVQAVLSGRVIQRGDDLTLYLSLVDGRNGNQLWGEQYNRKLADLVSLQSEIARDVSHKLRARLSGVDEKKVAKTYTENAEAYQLYLRGNYYLFEGDESGYKRSLDYFQQAIGKDPDYAQAYAGIANVYIEAADVTLTNREAMAKAKEAATKALELDDTVAEGHASMAGIRMFYDWNWPEAEKEYRRAIELNPNYALAHQGYSFYLGMVRGRYPEAIAEAKKAQQVDPLSLYANANVGYAYLTARRYDDASEQLHRTLELDQNYSWTHVLIGDLHERRGEFPEAIAEYEKVRQLDDTFAIGMQGNLGRIYARLGERDKAQKVIDKLKELSKQQHFVSSIDVAAIYAALNERERAIEWLEKGYQERTGGMLLLRTDPVWDDYRSDPGFQDVLRRVGLIQ